MSPRQSDVRQRVVVAAAEMLARHGLNAASIREIAKRADAPLGSTYHHFPGGKQQVVVEAVNYAGAQVSAQLERCLQGSARHGLGEFLAYWRNILVRSNFKVGCPVMAVATQDPIDEVGDEALTAAARVFNDWEGKLATAFAARGLDTVPASELATFVVASLEGAIVICRARRSIAAFDAVTVQLEALAPK